MKNRQKQVFSNIVLVVFLNLIVKPFWVFFIDRTVQVQNGNALYGIYGKYLSLSIVFGILLDLGLSSINQIMVAREEKTAGRDFASFWNTKLLLALAYLVLMHLIYLLIGSPREEYGIFLTVCLIQVFTSLSLFVRSSVSGLHLFRYDAWLSVVDKIFVLVVATTVIYGMGMHMDIVSYASIQAVGFFIVVALGIALLGAHRSILQRVDMRAVVFALRLGAPYALIIFCMGLYSRFYFFIIYRWSPGG